jgi:hypothetical protein
MDAHGRILYPYHRSTWAIESIFDIPLLPNTPSRGTRGITIDRRGKQQFTYMWILETSTNNHAKVYALLHGMISINADKVKNLIMINDSSIISILKNPSNGNMISLVERIQKGTH